MSDNLPEVSKSITEEAMWDSLPHEILTHVFLRLPIKSIITCTSVSKTWKSLFHFQFSTHLLQFSNNNNLLLFRLCPKPLAKAVKQLKRIGDEKEAYALHWDDNTNFHQYTSFDDFPFHGESATGELKKSDFSTLFDLEDEVFREIPLTKHSAMLYWRCVIMDQNYKFGCSSASTGQDISRPPSGFYSVKIPWAKAFRKSGEVILETYEKRLVLRNLETQEVKDLGITGSKFSFVDPYVESLVLLDKPDLAVTY